MGRMTTGLGRRFYWRPLGILSLLPPPKRSVIFFHTGAEEKGLIGAFRFVRDSLVPLDSIVAVLNVDMLGRTDTAHKPGENYLYAIGPAYTTPRLREIHEAVNALCCGWQFDYRYDDKNHPERLFIGVIIMLLRRRGCRRCFTLGGCMGITISPPTI
jgi:Zn-dependent M28 family amino/carboxypeptidase